MKKIICLVLALAMCACLFACGGKKTDSDLEYIKEKGTLVVGITNFAPMDYPDENGEWIGFDADMAREFAKYLGVDVQFIEIDWDNKILEINNKSIDCVWNGMTLRPEVTEAMDCSVPYCKNAQVVVVNSAVADQYQTKEDLAGLVFAVEAGSAGEDEVIAMGNEYTAVLTQSDALMNVAAGTADACIIDLLMAGAMIGEGTSYPELTYTVALNSEEYGVGFRKGSDVVAEFNKFYADAFKEGKVEEIAIVYGVQESIVG